MSEESLFHEALAKPATERAAFLDQACAGQPELRAAVEALLAAHEASSSFLKAPAVAELEAMGANTPQPQEAPPQPVLTTDHQPMITPGAVIAGRYTLQEKIGEGGMGEVWVAKQTEPVKRKVALKLIKAGMDSKAVLARFEAERQALALMDHPNIARVLDGGLTDDRRPFFVMELVNGLTLTRFCDETRLTPKERLELFVPICQAVQHAHQKGIVHRDLKPANILVTLIDGRPVPQIIDFGVAKATAGKLTDESLSTQFGAVVGTFEYMAPEQAGFAGEDIDTRADIYSLGVILYELLTGLRPLDGRRLRKAALTEMVRIIREEEPSRPSTRLSTDESLPSLAALRQTEPKRLMAMLRGELDWVVMKCLEKQRDRRYETANGLARDIQRYLADEPVEARPPSARYRLGKFLKRNKTFVGAAGVVLVALSAGMIGTTWGLLRSIEAEGMARTRLEEVERERAKAAALAVAEAKQREKAEKAEADTLADYRASTDDAIEQLIGSKVRLGPKEKKYLELTLKRWQAFAARQGSDRRNRAIRAEGHFRVASLWWNLGRNKEAQVEFQTAQNNYSKLVAHFPNVPEYREALALSHNNLGILFTDLCQHESARAEHQAARDILEKLVAQFSDVPKYQLDKAGTHLNLGNLLVGLGKPEEALAEYQTARNLQSKLVMQFPSAPEYREQLAGTHNNLARLFQDHGRHEEAHAEYETARGIFEKLVAQLPVSPAYKRGLARTRSDLGVLLNRLGKHKEAQTEYQAASDILKNLVRQFPAMPLYQDDLANTQTNLAALLDNRGRRVEAQAEYHAACHILEKLTTQFPDVPDYQQRLARTRMNLGLLLVSLRKVEEARAQYLAARDILTKLVARAPDVPDYQLSLATVHNHLGNLLFRRGQNGGARVEYQAACKILKRLIAQFPNVVKYQIELGGSYCNYGSVLSSEGSLIEGVQLFSLAVRTLHPVHDKDARDATARQFLFNSYANRAEAYHRLKQPNRAVNDWDRAIELSEIAERALLRASRAASQIQAGQVAEAVAEIADLSKTPNWNAGQWYDFACICALASGKSADKKQEYADRAMQLLHMAVKAGYQDGAHMRKDADLDSLRAREDFKKLLAELEKKSATEDAPAMNSAGASR
jgi:tetratricopeptide (TPR) repeat protein